MSPGTRTAPGGVSELPTCGFNSEVVQGVQQTRWLVLPGQMHWNPTNFSKNLTKSCSAPLALLTSRVRHYSRLSSHKTHPNSVLVGKKGREQRNKKTKPTTTVGNAEWFSAAQLFTEWDEVPGKEKQGRANNRTKVWVWPSAEAPACCLGTAQCPLPPSGCSKQLPQQEGQARALLLQLPPRLQPSRGICQQMAGNPWQRSCSPGLASELLSPIQTAKWSPSSSPAPSPAGRCQAPHAADHLEVRMGAVRFGGSWQHCEELGEEPVLS